MTVTPFNHSLAASQSIALPTTVDDEAASVLVSRQLLLPKQPVPPDTIANYVQIDTQTVQQVQHNLGISGASLDWGHLVSLEAQITFSDLALKETPVPAITLIPTDTTDSTDVLVPVATVVTGLPAIISFTAKHLSGPSLKFQVHNDFLEHPMYVLATIPSAAASFNKPHH